MYTVVSRTLAACALLAAAAGCERTRPTSTAERVTVSVTVNRDGTLDVSERWAMRFDGRVPDRFERLVRRRAFDQIDRVVADVDGGTEPARAAAISTRRDGSLRVDWPLEAAGSASRTFALRYHVRGAIRVEGTRGVLQWQAIPAQRDYIVEESRLTLAVDGGVDPARTGVAEAGWTVESTADGIHATYGPLAKNAGATLAGEWRVDPAVVGVPRWQMDDDRASEFAAAYVSGAIFILVIGAGVIWILRFQHPTVRASVRDAHPAEAGSLPPALAAGVFERHRRLPQAAMLGTILDLGRRGLLGLRWTSRRQVVVRTSDDRTALSHERVILDALQPLMSPDGVRARRVAGALGRSRRAFERAVEVELHEHGLVDTERVAVARGLEVSGLVTMFIGMLSAILVSLTLTRYGAWPMAMAAAIFVVGVALLFAGVLFSVLTAAGETESARWRARRRLIRRGTSEPSGTAWLPFMAAVGRDRRWMFRSITAAIDDRAFRWMESFEGEPKHRGWRRLLQMFEPKSHAH